MFSVVFNSKFWVIIDDFMKTLVNGIDEVNGKAKMHQFYKAPPIVSDE